MRLEQRLGSPAHDLPVQTKVVQAISRFAVYRHRCDLGLCTPRSESRNMHAVCVWLAGIGYGERELSGATLSPMLGQHALEKSSTSRSRRCPRLPKRYSKMHLLLKVFDYDAGVGVVGARVVFVTDCWLLPLMTGRLSTILRDRNQIPCHCAQLNSSKSKRPGPLDGESYQGL